MYDNTSRVIEVDIDEILPNRNQPRRTFDEDEILELSDSIKEHGVIQPIVVRQLGDKYEIIAGERRYKASVLAGKETIPVIIRNLNDKESAEVALIENVQRKNLSPIEEALSYKQILDMGYLTQENLASKLGKSQSTVANKIRLLNLTDEVQDALLENKISERHARSLLRIQSSKLQNEMLDRIIKERLTVRRTDEEIEKLINSNENLEDRKGEIKMNMNNDIFGVPSAPQENPNTQMNNYGFNVNPVSAQSNEIPAQVSQPYNMFDIFSNPQTTVENKEVYQPNIVEEPKTTPIFNPYVVAEAPKVVEEAQPVQSVQNNNDFFGQFNFQNPAPVEEVKEQKEEVLPNNIYNFNPVTPASEPNYTTQNNYDQNPFADINSYFERQNTLNQNVAAPVENENVFVPNTTPIIEKSEEDFSQMTQQSDNLFSFGNEFEQVGNNEANQTNQINEVNDVAPMTEVNNQVINESMNNVSIEPTPNYEVPTEETKIPEPIIITDYSKQYDPIMPQSFEEKVEKADFKDVVNAIRQCADRIEQLGYKIDVDEYDLSSNYQVMFKIEK